MATRHAGVKRTDEGLPFRSRAQRCPAYITGGQRQRSCGVVPTLGDRMSFKVPGMRLRWRHSPRVVSTAAAAARAGSYLHSASSFAVVLLGPSHVIKQ